MKLEAGKFYRARNGEKIGPMEPEGDGDFRAIHPVKNCIAFWHRDGMRIYHDPYCDLIAEWEDTPAKPKTWREMTDEEKGALLLDWNDNHARNVQQWNGSEWVGMMTGRFGKSVAYRIKPKVERVTLCSDSGTRRLTFDLTDGKPPTGEFRNDNGDVITLEEI